MKSSPTPLIGAGSAGGNQRSVGCSHERAVGYSLVFGHLESARTSEDCADIASAIPRIGNPSQEVSLDRRAGRQSGCFRASRVLPAGTRSDGPIQDNSSWLPSDFRFALFRRHDPNRVTRVPCTRARDARSFRRPTDRSLAFARRHTRIDCRPLFVGTLTGFATPYQRGGSVSVFRVCVSRGYGKRLSELSLMVGGSRTREGTEECDSPGSEAGSPSQRYTALTNPGRGRRFPLKSRQGVR